MMLAATVRPGGAEDSVDGVIPISVVEPATAEETAAVLAGASRDRCATVVRGGGTKDWGQTPAAVDLLVRTARLDSVVAHRHADLTASVQAGVRLGALNAALARQGQWLPVESAFEGATVGGIVATNDAGPARHRCGTPRDLLIGVTLALADGRLVTSGGHVVKNVAGYDLGRLVSGSHGSFAAIAEATFKLLPLPHATATLVVPCADAQAAGQHATALASGQLDPLSFDIRAAWPASNAASIALLVRFASSPGAVSAQVDSAYALVGGDRVTGDQEAVLWDEQLRLPWSTAGAVVRLAWLPAALPRVLALLGRVSEQSGASLMLAGRAGIGAGHLAVDGSVEAQGSVVALLRSSPEAGNVVVLRAAAELKRVVNVWGPPPSAAAALRALKHKFDPAGILNAGRGPF